MTTNQLRWAELQEASRHNKVTESIGAGTLSETTRHNVEWERQNWYSAQAQAAYQRMQGQASISQAGAAWRNALTREGELAETSRHNIVYEGVQSKQADTAWRNALTNAGQLTLEQEKWNSGGRSESWARAGLLSTQAQQLPIQTGLNAISSLGDAAKVFTKIGG